VVSLSEEEELVSAMDLAPAWAMEWELRSDWA
jgi:hypothetical protein